MTVQIGIVLTVFLLFIGLILSGRVKMHVAAMIIPIVLEITGILDFKDAWSGLSNNSVVMMASMFVVGAGIGKTSIVSRLSKALIKPGSSDFKIMMGITAPIILLGCFINATATMTIMIPMITAICAEQQRPLSKFMYGASTMSLLWAGFFPLGGNAGGYLANNTIVNNLGGAGTFNYFTNMTVKLPAVLVLTPIIIFLITKLAPDYGNIPQTEAAAAASGGGKRRQEPLTPRQEKITVLIFTLTIAGIIACAVTGVNTWYASTVGAFVMILSGVLSDREAIRAMGNPVIFITIGTLPLATAMKSTGADVLLADRFNQATGNMSPIMIMVFMFLICTLLTQFITNSAVNNAFKMLAALICVQNGYDARALMLSCQEGSSTCYLTPMAAPAMAMGYEAGGYKMKDMIKLGIPLCLARFLCFVIYVPIMFPLT